MRRLPDWQVAVAVTCQLGRSIRLDDTVRQVAELARELLLVR